MADWKMPQFGPTENSVPWNAGDGGPETLTLRGRSMTSRGSCLVQVLLIHDSIIAAGVEIA